MTAKEYLQQAYHLDQKIVSKQRQIEALREIATNCSPNMTGMPRNPSPSRSPMADAISKLVDIESELKTELAHLLQLKVEALTVIRRVETDEYKLLLEKRYLCYESWDDIALDLNCSVSWTLKLHRKALRAVDAILSEKAKRIVKSTKVHYKAHPA